MSHSPEATSAVLPLEEPPAERLGPCGFSTGPVSEVWLPPEKQRCSHTALPTISPPASRIRVTSVASTSGTYPSRTAEPFIIGIPATHTLSLIAIFLPASSPEGVPLIEHFQRSEEHTSELQSRLHLVCRLLLEKKKKEQTTLLHYRTYSSSSIIHNSHAS